MVGLHLGITTQELLWGSGINASSGFDGGAEVLKDAKHPTFSVKEFPAGLLETRINGMRLKNQLC